MKKSAVDLTELAIGIVVLGIVVSIGAIIMYNMGNTQITNAATYTVANESITPTTAGVGLANAWVKSVDLIVNGSAGTLIPASNYTVTISSDNGFATIANKTGAYSTWKATYTVYNTSDPRYDLPQHVQTGLAEYGNWFKIIVIVGVAAVILALIFMAFGNKSQSGGTVSTY